MALSEQQLLDALSRTPFVDSTELARILGEPHTTVHRALADLLADGIVGRVSHGTAHLPSSQRYHLTAQGIGEAAWVLRFATPSDFVRAYPMSREWLTLLIRRMDAVASVYRLAASMSPGIDGLRSRVEFHRRGCFDATITLHDGRSFGVVRQGLALRRRSLYDRLRAIAEYDYSRRPGTVLILVPSAWEERLTTKFCEDRNIRDCYVAVECREALEKRGLRIWCCTSWVIGSSYNRLVLELASRLRESGVDKADTVTAGFLKEQTAYAREWPSNEVVADALESSPLYRLLTRGRLRLVLEGVERRLRSSGKSEQPTVPTNLTIEHLMPVGWREEEWTLPEGVDKDVATYQRNTLIHSVGNLTLVTQKLNSSMSNDPWKCKRDELQEHSVLLLNNELLTQPSWDEQTIRCRSRRMAQLVSERWHGPASDEWNETK